MNLKLIACNVFLREACLCIARSPHVIDPEFLDIGQHVNSGALRRLLQERIDAAAAPPAGARRYDAILLLYGICGNASIGLRAPASLPLVMPRAHDCCTILLGSKALFRRHFEAAPSTPFSSSGYLERGDYFLRSLTGDGGAATGAGDEFAALVAQYGEEDAKYIWDTMHPAHGDEQKRAVFIDIPELAGLGHAAEFKTRAEAAGKELVLLPGSLDLIQRLLDGRWDAADFLTVPPGGETAGVYDWEQIVKVKAG